MGEDGSSPVLDTISADDFSEGFKRISINLSSSPSGLLIGHYKAVIGDEELCTLYARIISIPFKHGLTIPRWTSAVQVMLEKTKGCARVDKLQVIQPLETNLNMALQLIFGHCLIHRADDRGAIPLSQWGSRLNHFSTNAILLKRLSYDGLAILRKSAIIFIIGCKAAFD
jgi:hypothetical protein